MKKKIVVSSVIALVTALSATALVLPKASKGDFDLPGLNQQVQRHQETLDNHEGRSTNLENNQGDIQKNTNTPPATKQVPVPVVTTPAPQSTPTPTPPPAPSGDVIVGTSNTGTTEPTIHITRDVLTNLFAGIAPAGQLQNDKVSACFDLYKKSDNPSASSTVCTLSSLESYSTF